MKFKGNVKKSIVILITADDYYNHSQLRAIDKWNCNDFEGKAPQTLLYKPQYLKGLQRIELTR